MQHWDVVVVGAGPAGLVAAFRAAERGRRTLLLEKNRRPGVKILMSGGARCNLTHATDRQGIVRELGPQGRFLYSALSRLGPQEVVEMFAAEGVATKVEQPTGKVFPASDKAADVLSALVRRLERSGCTLSCEEPLERLERSGDGFALVTPRRTVTADKVILTTGGQSYPGCGTTGDGYAWAAAMGHQIVPPRPALVPLVTDAAWVHALSGLTIPDVLVRVALANDGPEGDRERGQAPFAGTARRVLRTNGACPLSPTAQRRGSFLFTHFGLSGPAVLDVSRVVSRAEGERGQAPFVRSTLRAVPANGACPLSPTPARGQLTLVCDFLPRMKPDELDGLVAQGCAATGKRQLSTILATWLPQRLAETLVQQAGLSAAGRGAELSAAGRRRLVQAVKELRIPLAGTLGFNKAEVTAGGVALAEVDSRDVQSKIVSNLYFAGELLDLDGPIGGYNFQIAFSTGWLAGESVG